MSSEMPYWVDYWAQYYNISPEELWANVQWGNSTASSGQQMAGGGGESGGMYQGFTNGRPGADIDINTGRRWVDTSLNPGGSLEQDIQQQWVTSPNSGPNNFMERIASYSPYIIGAMAGYGALGATGALGADVAAGGGAVGGSAPGEAAGAFTGSYPSAYAAPATGGLYGPPEAYAGYAPETGAYGPPAAGSPASYGYTDPSAVYGGSNPAAYPSTGGATGWPDVTGTNPTTGMPTTNDYMKYVSAAGSAMPSSSGSSSGGSPLGALVGAGLGYLDSANQPNSLTTSSQLDPAMAQLIYGQNGLVSMGANAVNANGGQYIDAAGQQISQMGQTGPTPYNELVANNQALWSANPFLAEQQKAITEQMNTNFANNTLPAIGTGASMNGGYGGSRQGVAQGLASTGNSTATANALTGLAYNSWNDAQNRAMQGAQYQGQYGLAGTAQQAALLQQGANMQAGAPWYNVNQFGNMIHQIPTTGSQTTPLFNNTTAGALGGAQTGYNYDWGSLISGIGGLFK